MKLFYVIGSLEIGGAEKQLVILLRHMCRQGHDCTLFVLQGDGALVPEAKTAGVRVLSGGLRKGDKLRAPWKIVSAQAKLMRAAVRVNPHILHAYLPLTAFMGSLAGSAAGGCAVVTSKRGLGIHQKRTPLFMLLDRAANALSDRITVNSMAVGRSVQRRERVPVHKIVCIYNGVDVRPEQISPRKRQAMRAGLGIESSQPIVTAVANLIPYKGHRDLIQAARRVVERFPDVRFLLVGRDSGIEAGLRRLVAQTGVDRNVLFLGPRRNVDTILAVSDISVLPSHEEGFSNVVLESMAAGIPVVATRVGGNPEAVVDGVTGWLCPPRAPEQLAAKIIDLLADPRKARLWGAAGKKRVCERFSIQRMVTAHAMFYRHLTEYTCAGKISAGVPGV